MRTYLGLLGALNEAVYIRCLAKQRPVNGFLPLAE